MQRAARTDLHARAGLRTLREHAGVMRWLALFMLACAAPGVSDALREMGCHAQLEQDCGAEADAGDLESGCEPGCEDCACCVHPNAVTTTAVLVPSASAVCARPARPMPEQAHSSGVRTRLFRPPTV